MAMLQIREFDPRRDRPVVRRHVVALQDFERKLDPRMPRGERIADAYLDLMLRRCREFDGVVLLAEIDRAVVGFVTIWRRYRSGEPDDDPGEHGFLSDLFVSATHRGSGIGRALLRAAEARAREAGAPGIRISVMAANRGARSLYLAEGFEEYAITLEKPLATGE